MMRVLYLAHRVPYAPNRGDRIRAYHTIRLLRARGVDVHVVALAHDGDELASTERLAELCTSYDVVRVPRLRNLVRGAAALAGARPLTHVLLDSPQMTALLARCRDAFRPDVVIALCSGMARFAVQPVLAEIPLVLDMVDVDSAKWAAMAAESHGLLRWVYAREHRRLRVFESKAAMAARATVVVNDAEAATLREIAPRARIVVIPVGIDVTHFRRPERCERRARVVFTGVFDYAPNVHGALWTIEHVWPRVLAVHPGAELVLAGARPTRRLRAAAARSRAVHVTGAVPDMRPYLWSAAAAIAPIAMSRGTQNKVLEALAAGLPAIITSTVAAGLPAAVRPMCIVADTPAAFAAAVTRALERQPAAESPLPGTLGWEHVMSDLLPLLDEAVHPARDRRLAARR
jgi:sugar transferase (PEP-CTERM/EpsH1 system associated)